MTAGADVRAATDVQTGTPGPSSSAERPHDAMTLVIPLQAKAGISLEDFYEYWLNAHITLPPRFPGISSVWLHVVSFSNSTWPAVDGVSMRPEPEDDFHGVPEATFPTMADLDAFIGASRVQMEDGINFLAQQIGYAGLGANSTTVRDDTDPAPDGTDTLVRHLVFLRKKPGESVKQFRAFVDGSLVPAVAAADQIRKLRRHLFEELDVTLDHPGVVMSKPLDRQYQAMLEVVVDDDAALTAYAASAEWTRAAAGLAEHCAAVHPARVDRCITTKHDGRITLAGIRGVAVADVIRRMHADSQTSEDVSREFLPPTVARAARA
jgi:hypothetical protein